MTQAAEPTPLETLNADRLGRWLADHLEGFRPPLTVEQLPGGQSNPTYKLITAQRAYVMRTKPPGKLLNSAHAVEREYRAMTALAQTNVPVPKTHLLCEDGEVIGRTFFVMDFVPGVIHWRPEFPDVPREKRAAHFDAMNAGLASLHRVDPRAVGLGDFGKSSGYLERQIRRWTRQYEADPDAGRLDRMDRLAVWLGANVPDDDELSIVHGDFRCNNLMFHPDRAELTAILDWELATLGHPVTDFAFHLMMYRVPPNIQGGGIKGMDLAELNIPSEDDYVAAYCRRTGRNAIPHLQFHIAYNLFRFAAIIHGIKGRAIRGNASSGRANEVAAALETFVDLAWDEARGAGMT